MGKKGKRQIAALPWQRDAAGQLSILLITSRETKRWVIPKGWPMGNLKDFNAAKREALEEAGVEGRVRRKAIGRFGYDKKLKGGEVIALQVTVFALEVRSLLDDWPELGQRKRQWFRLDDAAKAVGEPELAQLIGKFSSLA